MCVCKTWVWGNFFVERARSSLLRSERLFLPWLLRLPSTPAARVWLVRRLALATCANNSLFAGEERRKILNDWRRRKNIWSWSKSPFYSVYGDVMMILIVEYTLALYSKNTELMVISMPTPLFIRKIIFHIIPLIICKKFLCPGFYRLPYFVVNTCQHYFPHNFFF